MSLATIKQLRDFIWTELPINYRVKYRVNYLVTKEKQTETTKGCPTFEWIIGIPITDKDDETQSEEYEIASKHEDENDDDINEK